MPTASAIAKFADNLLVSSETPDYPNALNGLQVDTDKDVRKVCAAVDFSNRTVRAAVGLGADLLVVHHGAFWSGATPLTGPRYDVMAALFANSLGVYASHLPLDRHPVIGNNVLLAKQFSLVPQGTFGKFEGVSIGVSGHSTELLSGLMKKVRAFSEKHGGNACATAYPSDRAIGAWAICTGSGADASTLKEAAERGLDTLIVGEGPHWTTVHAEDRGIVLIYAGHYATETLGVQALAEAIAHEFQIEWEFVPAPTTG